jgi:uncharacterized protein (DUF427 family)
MPTREVKLPGPDHPITIAPSTEHVVVRAGDRVVADTTAALGLRESNYPVVLYVPLADVDQNLLQATDTSTYCPYKGDASYYSIVTDGGEIADAIWTYEQPYPAVAEIAEHVAFYADRVEISTSAP